MPRRFPHIANVENMTNWATEALEAALTHAATY